jgi:signal peptidase II
MRSRFYLLTAGVLILDHLTKWLVRTRMDLHDAIELIPNLLRLSYVRNSGVAFGLFADLQSVWKPYVLAGMAVIAVAVILVYSSRTPMNRVLLQVALAITMGGILGNFTDRVMHGFVVDFVEFHYKELFYWPTFNVADSAISIGIALLLIDTVKNPELEEELQSQ